MDEICVTNNQKYSSKRKSVTNHLEDTLTRNKLHAPDSGNTNLKVYLKKRKRNNNVSWPKL